MKRQDTSRYTLPAIMLHWLMAFMILGLFGLGLYMSGLPLSPRRLQLFAWHKWAGMLVLALWCLRIGWRLLHQPPALPGGMPAWQEKIAGATHWALYGLMLLVPLSGWLMSSASGFTVVMFGKWPLPNLLAANHALGETLKTVHHVLNYAFMGLVGLHVLAVIQHQFLLRDGLLQRMLPEARV